MTHIQRIKIHYKLYLFCYEQKIMAIPYRSVVC